MLHVGALLDRAPGRKYTAALRFAEFAPRGPLPRPGTLASMRAGLPEGFAFSLRAPRNSVSSSRGTLRMDEQLEAGRAWLLSAADALAARAVVFNTPADLTPGARSRDLLREYVGSLPRVDGRHYVWWPQGVWEAPDAQALCAELGLVYGFDPLETRPGPSEIVYATLRAFGHRSGFSLAALSDAVSLVTSHAPKEAFLSVDAERAFDIARRIRGLSDSASETPTATAAEPDDQAFDEDVDDEDEDHDALDGDE
ncbi:MAG TPA: DUF72 domain-containing protein, partial [Polyangiales bacterium]|nr:DUF72 domain-containing protein [Polyangiales bacterium]